MDRRVRDGDGSLFPFFLFRGSVVIPAIEFTQDGEMSRLEWVAMTTSFQGAGHQVAEIDIGRCDVRRQSQFELRLGWR